MSVNTLHDALAITQLQRVTWKDMVRDYIALTKPRVISLLLFTTLAAMFVAADSAHRVTLPLFFAVLVGGYAAAGAANAINMVIDRDIDQRMRRTTTRPTVTKRISARNGLAFAFTLEALSFALLTVAANVLSASLALAGLLFYVFIYTLLLKRRTWHNIVIGGAAGAFPPLVGWAAVTGSLSILAWYLFVVIFVWTPVHFWALALLIQDDYASAGVPMLPCVKGDRATAVQIALYAVGTVAVTMLPALTHEFHTIYVVGAVALNVVLARKVVELYREVTRHRASSLFHYSMLYLALLFLVMAIDRTFT